MPRIRSGARLCHNPYRLPCSKCGKEFRNSSGLTQHFNTAHIIPETFSSALLGCAPRESDKESTPASDGPGSDQSNGEESHPPSHRAEDHQEVPLHTRKESHSCLNGRPCDAAGNFLEDSAAPLAVYTQPGNYKPYRNRIEFEVAELLFKRAMVSNTNLNINRLLDLWAAHVLRFGEKPPFVNQQDLYATIDSTPFAGALWQAFKCKYTGPRPNVDVPPWMDEEYEVCFCDARDAVRIILANPSFGHEFDVAPYREYCANGDRRYSQVMSGNWAWRQADMIAQDERTHGSLFVPVVCGSDKTTVSVATGQNDYYPVYLTIGNVWNRVRRAHRDAVVPIAFLALPKVAKKWAKRDDFRRFQRQLFHSSMSIVLGSLREGMTTPEVAQCPDGHFRRIIYGLGPHLADYPEQVLYSLIVQGWCPTCRKRRTELGSSELGPCRHREHTELLVSALDPAVLWDDYGIVSDVVPFTVDFPRADAHELLAGDLLHQVIKGGFKDHLVSWVDEYLTITEKDDNSPIRRATEASSEIDRRISVTPPFPGLRHFYEGRDFKQWTGDDLKALMKVYLPAIAGLLPDEMVQAVATFMEFCYLARRSDFTESSVRELEEILTRYHAQREVFRTTNVRPDGFDSLPRQYSLFHYPQHIRNFGAPNGLSTSITESMHIEAVKKPWRRSSKFNALSQMLLTNQRLAKLAASRTDFTTRGMLEGSCLSLMDLALSECADGSSEAIILLRSPTLIPSLILYLSNISAAFWEGDDAIIEST